MITPSIRAAVITVLVALASVSAWASGDAGESVPAIGETVATEPARTEEERVQESEHARRLSRARREHEARRTQDATRLEAEQLREKELTRLNESASGLGRRESYLRHERYWTRREYDSISRDPADISAMARRGALERELYDIRHQLDSAGTGRQNALRQLDSLRLR
jgi:hypothetical protein